MYKTILFISLSLFLASCTGQPERDSSPYPKAVGQSVSVPYGFSVVEQNDDGYFIRLSSPERASVGALHTIAESLSGTFDRIDLCLDVAHERGDEYLSIVAGKVYDYENDNIYPL